MRFCDKTLRVYIRLMYLQSG